jgi:ABC-type nickel/cobalt efflux system permease component RcnA
MGEVDHDLEGAPISTIISTGLLLGIVHVITGPDHLSALIVLSAGSSWRSATLGMRWGAGHSTGLIIVTAIFLAVNQEFDVDTMGTYCDFIVGILMVMLGLWSMRHYWRMRNEYHEEKRNGGTHADEESGMGMHHHHHHGSVMHTATQPSPKTSFTGDVTPPQAALERNSDAPAFHKQSFDETIVSQTCCFGKCTAPSSDIKNPRTQQLTAFAYGIAHGLAGTGGVLGVLPAVVLNDWAKSSAYLLSFCAASIFIMGVFAASYGEITGRLSQFSASLLYRIGLFSASVSLIVGIVWIILVSTGTLDAVFG